MLLLRSIILILILFTLLLPPAAPFLLPPPSSSVSRLSASPQPPPPKPPRRSTPSKSTNSRRRRIADLQSRQSAPGPPDDSYWEGDIRPLVSAERKEAGADFWISEEDLRAEEERVEGEKNRKLMEGDMPASKLREEIVAPYTNNWIGFVVGVVLLISLVFELDPTLFDGPIVQELHDI